MALSEGQGRYATFLAVLDAGSIRSAAERLNIVPSALSRQISLLEHDYGVALLRRSAHGVEPTDAGRHLAEVFRERVEEEHHLRKRLLDMDGAGAAEISLMCGEGFIADLMQVALPDFTRAYTDIRFKVCTGSSGAMTEALLERRCDLALAFNPEPRRGVLSIIARRHPLRVVVRADHPLATSTGASFAEVAALPAAILPEGNGVRALLTLAESESGCSINSHTVADSIDYTRRFVREGLGVTYLPPFCIEPDDGDLVAVRLTDSVLRNAQAHLLVPASHEPEGPVGRLARHLAAGMSAFR